MKTTTVRYPKPDGGRAGLWLASSLRYVAFMHRELRRPRRAAMAAIVCVSLVACGGKSESTPEALIPVARGDSTLLFGSGTRLKAHYLDAGGGA
jgi:hypothetical protein